MAADLTPVLQLLVFGIAAGVAGPACSQALPDPTRPPDAFRPPLGSTPAAPTAPRFASLPVVILSSDRQQVTINGQTVKLGGRIADAKVIRISDTEVVLQSAEGIESIRFYGAAEKKVLKPGAELPKGSRAVPTESGK